MWHKKKAWHLSVETHNEQDDQISPTSHQSPFPLSLSFDVYVSSWPLLGFVELASIFFSLLSALWQQQIGMMVHVWYKPLPPIAAISGSWWSDWRCYHRQSTPYMLLLKVPENANDHWCHVPLFFRVVYRIKCTLSCDVRSMCFDGPVFPLYDFEHGSHKTSPFWCSQIYDSCLSLKTSWLRVLGVM